MKIGVLAFQGGFSAHMKILSHLGAIPIEVRTEEQLQECQALVLPGGESTTMNRLMKQDNFNEFLRNYATSHPLFGTCAGMIVMAQEQILDIAIERNSYGRQIASFITPLSVHLSNGSASMIEAVFIRAPRIKGILSSAVEILATHQGTPVLVRQGSHLGASFHPELTEDLQIHRFFLQIVMKEMMQSRS